MERGADESRDSDEARRLVEALILAAAEPIAAARIAEIVPDADAACVRRWVKELNADYRAHGRAFEIQEIAGGFQIRTLAEFAPCLQQLHPQRPLRLSQAALETLAIIAYKQPATRADVEHVRGVEVGAVLRGLLERHLIRLAGHREVPGRPLLYGTTRRFLEVFGLNSLSDLPTLREIEELGSERSEEAAASEGA
jgi:segregation and condensation protein B